MALTYTFLQTLQQGNRSKLLTRSSNLFIQSVQTDRPKQTLSALFLIALFDTSIGLLKF